MLSCVCFRQVPQGHQRLVLAAWRIWPGMALPGSTSPDGEAVLGSARGALNTPLLQPVLQGHQWLVLAACHFPGLIPCGTSWGLPNACIPVRAGKGDVSKHSRFGQPPEAVTGCYQRLSRFGHLALLAVDSSSRSSGCAALEVRQPCRTPTHAACADHACGREPARRGGAGDAGDAGGPGGACLHRPGNTQGCAPRQNPAACGLQGTGNPAWQGAHGLVHACMLVQEQPGC